MILFASGISVLTAANQILIATNGGTFFMVHVGNSIAS
jgi:hypothetical protein